MANRDEVIVRTHRDLRIWQAAIDLADSTYDLTEGFPKCEQYGITAQMRQAAVSVAANIAEGSGRNTTRDFLRFLGIAKGSLRELETYAEVSRRRTYATEQQIKQLLTVTEAIGRMHTKLRAALRRKLHP